MERQRVMSGAPHDDIVGYCRAVRVGKLCVVSGTAPIGPDGSCPDDVELQARRCFEIVVAGLIDPRWRLEVEAEAIVADA